MPRILVAEDERDIAVLIKFLLEQEGHSVALAHDGAEALRLLGVAPPASPALPDLLVIDVMMPLVDGLEVCRRLRESPRAQGMPVLVLTAKGELRSQAGQAQGVSAFLEKPFDPKAFREAVAKLLPRKP